MKKTIRLLALVLVATLTPQSAPSQLPMPGIGGSTCDIQCVRGWDGAFCMDLGGSGRWEAADMEENCYPICFPVGFDTSITWCDCLGRKCAWM